MKIGKAKLDVIAGDITRIPVEAIVNPANNMLWMGGGVSALIRKAGGESIETESLKKAPAPIGEAVETKAGALAARWIIHAVITGQDLVATESAIRKAMRASLVKADSLRCTSLVVPILTTEISHVEIHIIAYGMVEETVKFLIQDNKSLEYVAFADNDESVRKIINDKLLEMFTKHG
ncbi:macro domain-containing protein [bacterium]|nr:macro domain-containing protein [bacterium]